MNDSITVPLSNSYSLVRTLKDGTIVFLGGKPNKLVTNS